MTSQLPIIVYDDEAVCFHLGFPLRYNSNHSGMIIGEYMKIPFLERMWTFGLDTVDEIIELLENSQCEINDNTKAEIKRRNELFKFINASQP